MISKAKDKQVSSDVELAKQNSVAAASAVLNSVNSKTAEDDKTSNKNPENANTELRKPAAAAAAATVSEKKTVKVVKKVDDPIVANFTVEGWPESKSRIATDYVNYDEQTAILQPNQVFLSPDAGMLFHKYLTQTQILPPFSKRFQKVPKLSKNKQTNSLPNSVQVI